MTANNNDTLEVITDDCDVCGASSIGTLFYAPNASGDYKPVLFTCKTCDPNNFERAQKLETVSEKC